MIFTVRRLLGRRVVLVSILVWRLGLINILRALVHRLRLRWGCYQAALPLMAGEPESEFWRGGTWCFDPTVDLELRSASLARGDEILAGVFRLFEDEQITEGVFPQWHKDSYRSQRQQHFSNVAINAVPGDDVKRCWDLSRFKWLGQLVVAAIHANDAVLSRAYLDRAQVLLSDWLLNNGYFQGVNWACGQEVSIRGLHLMHALMLLDKHFGAKPTAASLAFLSNSCRRVEITLNYSLAQENNHSLTESLFLFYAPLFIDSYGSSVSLVRSVHSRERTARSMLKRLVQRDGSLRMYSINYHRAMCDILSLYKLLDDGLGVGFWDDDLLRRASAMHAFLCAVTTESGRVPSIGHNDGSLHVIQYSPYNDHMPSLALMSCAFDIPLSRKFSRGVGQAFLFGRRPVLFDPPPVERIQCFDDFGLVIVRYSHYQAFLKYARNSGRPSQEDFIHFDLWVRGENLLHDCGSFSYNPNNAALIECFDGAQAHNGFYLKGRPLVPRLSRFLYLEWPRVKIKFAVADSSVRVDMSLFLTQSGNFHRLVIFERGSIRLIDNGPPDVPWSICFNVPSVLSVSGDASHLTLCDGVTLSSDGVLDIGLSLFSKRYLDAGEGARVNIDGALSGRHTKIEIQEV